MININVNCFQKSEKNATVTKIYGNFLLKYLKNINSIFLSIPHVGAGCLCVFTIEILVYTYQPSLNLMFHPSLFILPASFKMYSFPITSPMHLKDKKSIIVSSLPPLGATTDPS